MTFSNDFYVTAHLINDQKKWMASCGATLEAYLAKYGDERGRRIHMADTAALAVLELRMSKLK